MDNPSGFDVYVVNVNGVAQCVSAKPPVVKVFRLQGRTSLFLEHNDLTGQDELRALVTTDDCSQVDLRTLPGQDKQGRCDSGWNVSHEKVLRDVVDLLKHGANPIHTIISVIEDHLRVHGGKHEGDD